MFHISSGMGQYQITNISKYGELESILSIGVLHKIICIIDHIDPTSWDNQTLQYLLSTENYNRVTISTEPIIFGFMNIFIVYPQKTSTLLALYPFNITHKVLLVIWVLLIRFCVAFILHLLVFCDANILTYELDLPPSGRKYVSIDWITKPSTSHIFLIQLQTN